MSLQRAPFVISNARVPAGATDCIAADPLDAAASRIASHTTLAMFDDDLARIEAAFAESDRLKARTHRAHVHAQRLARDLASRLDAIPGKGARLLREAVGVWGDGLDASEQRLLDLCRAIIETGRLPADDHVFAGLSVPPVSPDPSP